MKTRSAYVRAPWQFELREVELPETPPAGEVMLRVKACGICGTDLTIAGHKASAWQPFGHEVAGVIEQVGSGVGHLSPGQAVVLETSSFCGRCERCRDGRVDLCHKAPAFWGRPAMGFADRMVAPVACVVPYEGLDPVVASLAEPAGVAIDMIKTARIEVGDRVAVVGPGPIGLIAAGLAVRQGAERVVCIGHAHSKRRLELAGELGAEAVVAEGPLDQREDLAKRFDHVLLTSPVGTVPAGLSLLDYGGELTYIGVGAGGGDITFDGHDFHFRKLQLRASFASPGLYLPMVMRLLKAGVIPGEKFVSHRFKLAQIGEAMAVARDDKATSVKVVVTPD